MEFEKSLTQKNLAKVYISECQDSARYALISQKADEMGEIYLSKKIKILSKRELAHATLIYNLLLQYGTKKMENIEITASYPFETIDVKEGLFNSSQSEKYQANNVYPDFLSIAKDEGFFEIANTLKLLAGVENKNFEMLTYLTENFGKYHKNAKTLVCSNCGFEKPTKTTWKTCPLCKKGEGFIEFNINKIY